MSEWKEVSLSELGKTITGKTPSSQYPEDFGDEVPFITPSDSFEKKYISRSERYLSRLGSDRLKDKIISSDSIMVTCIGSAMGKVAKNSLPSVTNQQINSIIVNENFDSDYIYYLFKNNYAVFRNAASGSTAIPILNKTDFDNLRFKVELDLNQQRKMVSILSKIDDKSEINNQINQELEAMAKTLYDYWFVQFDFPDRNGKPYKSSGGKMVYNQELKREIPEGWGVEKLDDLGTVVGGSTPTKSISDNFTKGGEGYSWITPNDLSNNKGNKFIKNGEIDVTVKGLKDASLKLYPEGTVLMSSRAPVGYLAIATKELTTNQGFKSFIPDKKYDKNYIYYTLQNCLKVIEQNASGSTFKEISATVLKDIKVLQPNLEIVKKFEITVSSINNYIRDNEVQNQELTQLRDWLLPMLMNGQVKVE